MLRSIFFFEVTYLQRTLLALLALTLAGALLLVLSSDPADAATTFTVNRTNDAKDAKLSDSKCDTNLRKTGKQCTLRAAIEETRATPNPPSDPDLINFNIGGIAPVKTINVGSTGLGSLPFLPPGTTIDGYSQPRAQENTLAEGNNAVLKVELNGTNAATGIRIGCEFCATSNVTVKGLVINRFSRYGVAMYGYGDGGNRVEGNFIGTDASGSKALGNRQGGVLIFKSRYNTVGGTSPAARNVISANGSGVAIIGIDSGAPEAIGPSYSNKVMGNYIGTDATGMVTDPDGIPNNGDELGNSSSGVFMGSFSGNNTIGGTPDGAGNIISGNGRAGVRVCCSSWDFGNSILSNSIYSNDELGIDLGNGVTSNDTDDPDLGPNHGQNFPEKISAVRDSITGTTTISATLGSNPNQNYTIQCFLTEAGGDPSGHGEGKTLLDTTTTTTDDNGDSPTFSCTSDIPKAGDLVSMTATNTSGTATNTSVGDTSEFSENEVVTSST